ESDHQFVPTDRRNLAYQAAQLMMRRYNIKSGVTINIDKHIPIAAGLAGGSADAAATFRGMNALYVLGVELDELAELSAELEAYTPICHHGSTALPNGRRIIRQLLPRPPHA